MSSLHHIKCTVQPHTVNSVTFNFSVISNRYELDTIKLDNLYSFELLKTLYHLHSVFCFLKVFNNN